MSTKQNNLFYVLLMSLTVIFTLGFIYDSGLSNSNRPDEAWDVVQSRILSLIPMAIMVKIYNDIRKLLSTQKHIIVNLNTMQDTNKNPDDSGNATWEIDATSKQAAPPAKLWKDT